MNEQKCSFIFQTGEHQGVPCIDMGGGQERHRGAPVSLSAQFPALHPSVGRQHAQRLQDVNSPSVHTQGTRRLTQVLRMLPERLWDPWRLGRMGVGDSQCTRQAVAKVEVVCALPNHRDAEHYCTHSLPIELPGAEREGMFHHAAFLYSE